jgi:hypothetical protein
MVDGEPYIGIGISIGTGTGTGTVMNLSSTMMYEAEEAAFEEELNHTIIANANTGVLAIQLIASSIAVILCSITILAMILPLFEKRKRKKSSTYNLYLVFLAIPDLVYNSFLIYLFATYHIWIPTSLIPSTTTDEEEVFQRATNTTSSLPLVDHPFDLALFTACGTLL